LKQKSSQNMTLPKSSVLVLFCFFLPWAIAQEDVPDAEISAETSTLDESPATEDGALPNAWTAEAEDQTDAAGEPAEDSVVETADDENQRVFDLRLEHPASEGENAEVEITLDRFESRSTYRNYMDAKQYPEAVAMAMHTLQLSEEEFGRDNVELVPVLNELGLALLFTRQPEIAVQHFERSIDLVEENQGIFSAQLVDPLTGMGLANQQMENHAGAINYFLRSQHVIHRDQGVTDLSQANVMNMLTQSLLAEERFTDAENVQEAILKIHKMNYGADSGRIARPMMSLANWQRRYGLLTNSRYLYRSSIELRLTYLDSQSSDMKPVLEKLGLRYFDVMAPSWMQGYQFSDDVIDALTIHRESLSSEDHVLSYLAVGDQLLLFGDHRQAQLAYSKAWSLASDDENSEYYRGNYFDTPTILNSGAGIDKAKMDTIDADEMAYAKFSFDLEPSGRPTRIKVVESNLDKKHWKFAVRNFRSARFRPVLRSGVAQTSADLNWKRVFPRGRQVDPARARNAYAWLMTYSSYSHLTR